MIKKLFFTVCFLCLFSAIAIQLKAQPIPHLGIRLGVNAATVSGVEGGFGKRRVGLVAGVYGHFMIGKSHFSIQPELLYTQKGINRNVFGYLLRVHSKLKINYIEIPVLFKYTFIPNATVRPSIYLGPYAGYNIVAKKEKTPDISVDSRSQIEIIDFGFSTGVGIAFGRYHLGFRFTFAAAGVSSSGSYTGYHRNSVFSFVTGVDI